MGRLADDLLHDESDELFAFVLDFVDGLPKVYNTVDVAISRVGITRPIEVVGNITAVPEPIPVPISRSDREEGRSESLFNKSYQFFHMSGEQFTMLCAIHNVVDLTNFPYGKDDDEYERIVQKVQYAYKNGRSVQVIGRFITITANRKQQRILYVDTVNIEEDALMSKMLRSQFDRFIEICHRHNVNPLDVFMDEVFTFYKADDYLKKTTAVFCLTPKSREEMLHILILSAPGEGKDYWIDKVIQPMVKCGKVGSDQVTTYAALVGAMSTQDLRSLGVGILQKYHNERLAASEVQTWSHNKFGALIDMMANGYVTVSKGQIQDAKRPACENILMVGNIPNNWKEGMEPMKKLDSVMGGNNKQYAKQLMSRFTLMFARVSLLKEHNSMGKLKIMVKNIDDNSAMADESLFFNDDVIKSICSRTDLKPKEKSHKIRERKFELLRSVGKTDTEIQERLRHRIFQEFFGQYFKFVSVNLPVRVEPVLDVLYRTLQSMSKSEGFDKILCNESGELDPRKFQQFSNLCKSFAKLQGHESIEAEDISEAEMLFKEHIATLADFGSLLFCGLDMIELDILKFVAENQPVTEDEIKSHIKMAAGVGSADSFFVKNMDSLNPYFHFIADKYLINYDAIPDDLRSDLNIRRADTITEKDSMMHRDSVSDTELESRLDGIDFEED